MNLANPQEGAETLGIFSDLPSETTEAEPQQSGQTAQPGEAAKTTNDVPETQQSESSKGDTEALSRRVKAQLDGREIEFDVVTDGIDPSLVSKGVMMESDYRKKTMEHANNVRAFEEQKTKALAELYDQIEYEAKQLDSDELKELKELDPDEFERRRLNVEKKTSLFKKYQDERKDQLINQQREIAQQELSKLPEMIPEWLDDKVKTEEAGKIANMMRSSYGFSDEEIGSIYDSRAISILRKAALYDEIQNTSLENNRKQKAPKHSKSNSTAESKKVEEPSIESIFYGN
jgi:hypothetical protein